jgi:Ricin-type beta-trefoil lectin domain
MMRGIRRLVVYTAVSGLLAAGAIGATMEVAHANFAALCDGNSGNSYACTLQANISDPTDISVSGTVDADEDIALTWTISCTDNNTAVTQPQVTTGGITGEVTTAAAVTQDLSPLPSTADGQCAVTANVSVPTTDTTPAGFSANLDYTPGTSATASASPGPSPVPASVHPIKGFDGKCVDDNGNSSANRAKVQIWSCGANDQAENWKFSSNELIHNGKCLNDQGNAGSGGHVILYSCNGGSNEKWSELANGELKLQSHGGAYCLDDPRSSTTNGTQLIVYTCHDSANQKWSLP